MRGSFSLPRFCILLLYNLALKQCLPLFLLTCAGIYDKLLIYT